MEAKHTPGPWSANAIKAGRIIGDAGTPGADKIQINNSNATVATVYRPMDARLIAAAPDLLAALTPLAAWAENERRKHNAHGEDNEAAYMGALADAARAAIARATEGRSAPASGEATGGGA